MRTIDFAPAGLACLGKEQYPTANLAAKVARRRNVNKKLRMKAPSRPLGHYRCGRCGFWHIGGFKTVRRRLPLEEVGDQWAQ